MMGVLLEVTSDIAKPCGYDNHNTNLRSIVKKLNSNKPPQSQYRYFYPYHQYMKF